MDRVQKSADIDTLVATDEDLALINRHTLAPLGAEDVFTFKAVLCDNVIDRDGERFSDKALHDLCRLFVGKTVIKNHTPNADNQVARIYAADVVQPDTSEDYKQLVARCYMVKTDSNADMIAEIIGGIRKEGSISCSVARRLCSVCGTDRTKTQCRHIPGRTYDGVQCSYVLDGVTDAYEFSLVAVPSQRNAGISKSYDDEDQPQENPADDTETMKELETRARLYACKARIEGGKAHE